MLQTERKINYFVRYLSYEQIYVIIIHLNLRTQSEIQWSLSSSQLKFHHLAHVTWLSMFHTETKINYFERNLPYKPRIVIILHLKPVTGGSKQLNNGIYLLIPWLVNVSAQYWPIDYCIQDHGCWIWLVNRVTPSLVTLWPILKGFLQRKGLLILILDPLFCILWLYNIHALDSVDLACKLGYMIALNYLVEIITNLLFVSKEKAKNHPESYSESVYI